VLALLLLAGAASAGESEGEAASSTAPDPSAVVERLHSALIAVMKQAETLGYRGRYQQLTPVLPGCFDLPFMAQKSVGRYWKAAAPEDQQALVETFIRYSIANYAGRFEGYSGQHFETLGQEPAPRGTVLVRTQLIDPTGEDVKLDYRLREVDEGWRIIDVFLNGTVSELALRRSEYSTLIQRDGFQALIAALDERIDELAEADPADQAS
jgi:phospholipid transport system substrate-binding protein